MRDRKFLRRHRGKFTFWSFFIYVPTTVELVLPFKHLTKILKYYVQKYPSVVYKKNALSSWEGRRKWENHTAVIKEMTRMQILPHITIFEFRTWNFSFQRKCRAAAVSSPSDSPIRTFGASTARANGVSREMTCSEQCSFRVHHIFFTLPKIIELRSFITQKDCHWLFARYVGFEQALLHP